VAEPRDTARVEAFSDGVFAIAMTLLVLEIRVPELPEGATNRALGHALVALWPSIVAFVASFATILTMWTHHHHLCALVRRVDRRLFFANGLLLLLVTFIPFPTAVAARNIGCSAARAATMFYCGTFFLMALAFQVFFAAVARDGDAPRPEAERREIDAIRRTYLLGPSAYAGAALLGFFSPLLGFLVCAVMWIFWSLIDYLRGSG
jgi:TMEM175 potassium channel family protein